MLGIWQACCADCHAPTPLALIEAERQTGPVEPAFPAVCPSTFTQVMDDGPWPDHPTDLPATFLRNALKLIEKALIQINEVGMYCLIYY